MSGAFCVETGQVARNLRSVSPYSAATASMRADAASSNSSGCVSSASRSLMYSAVRSSSFRSTDDPLGRCPTMVLVAASGLFPKQQRPYSGLVATMAPWHRSPSTGRPTSTSGRTPGTLRRRRGRGSTASTRRSWSRYRWPTAARWTSTPTRPLESLATSSSPGPTTATTRTGHGSPPATSAASPTPNGTSKNTGAAQKSCGIRWGNRLPGFLPA